MRERLRELARDAWKQHDRAQRDSVPHLVRPSIPILFFGDSERFASSPRRVITVGLNPSREEFPRRAPLLRFPAAEGAAGDPDRYLASLDAYFRTVPYTGWFNPSFEQLLRGLGASYSTKGRRSRSTQTSARRSRPIRPGRVSTRRSRRCSSRRGGGCGTSSSRRFSPTWS